LQPPRHSLYRWCPASVHCAAEKWPGISVAGAPIHPAGPGPGGFQGHHVLSLWHLGHLWHHVHAACGASTSITWSVCGTLGTCGTTYGLCMRSVAPLMASRDQSAAPCVDSGTMCGLEGSVQRRRGLHMAVESGGRAINGPDWWQMAGPSPRAAVILPGRSGEPLPTHILLCRE
jgi:hypothetical protein